MRKNSDKAAAIAAAGLVAVLVVGSSCRPRQLDGAAAAGESASAQVEGGQGEPVPTSPANQPAPVPVKMIYEKTPGSFAHLVDKYQRAVVNVRATRTVKGGPATIYPGSPRDESLGTGFVIRRDGLILTDLRVVATTGEFRVSTHDGEEYPARLLGSDPHLDIGLLRADGLPADIHVFDLERSEPLDVGQWVVALGSPFAGEITANPGVISGLGKRREIANSPQHKYRGFIQTTAAIHAGNSGGPLIDLGGSVVGVNHAISPHASFIGFAVPASEIAQIFQRLEQGNAVSRAWLGIRFLPVNRARAKTAGLGEPRGTYVSEVRPGQPADRAGMKPGDIVLFFDGNEVTADNLPGLLHRMGPGRRVDVVVWRNRTEMTLQLTTGRMIR
ncbi:MAG: trypsin-like peptidase domain-containing protein [Proteobacteria bacterium]|nr:trypsin-like peptidase domain-containing protein [Pseudomonadota bacterium]